MEDGEIGAVRVHRKGKRSGQRRRRQRQRQRRMGRGDAKRTQKGRKGGRHEAPQSLFGVRYSMRWGRGLGVDVLATRVAIVLDHE
ncbi:hypothetical protein BHE74_00008513 [Ensete ventricosum]|nr:hypothetical protein GW17_00016296 [Ensete ventricosum]RWW83000.1 hypothetical protein BHE74_00008513 [Ensete ventricosum]RZR86737.1 hypothetical protein BHM03_00013989 [Ensete ventricosum]